jgi:uncharacterized membrane protein
MLYLWVKFFHIVSSTVLFGTGMGTATIMWFAHRTKDVRVIAATARYVVSADWIFTGSSGCIQPLTGFWMVYLAGYSLNSLWLWGSLLGYLIAACCWFPVVYLQIKMRKLSETALQTNSPLPPAYFRCFKIWFYLGWPAFLSLIMVFFLMTNKPM